MIMLHVIMLHLDLARSAGPVVLLKIGTYCSAQPAPRVTEPASASCRFPACCWQVAHNHVPSAVTVLAEVTALSVHGMQGFVKVAIQAGADLVPAYHFGSSQMLSVTGACHLPTSQVNRCHGWSCMAGGGRCAHGTFKVYEHEAGLEMQCM